MNTSVPSYFFRGSGVPIVISLWFLVRLWREGELFGTQQVLSSLLLLKDKIDHIY